jgi:hypothetical protein
MNRAFDWIRILQGRRLTLNEGMRLDPATDASRRNPSSASRPTIESEATFSFLGFEIPTRSSGRSH